MYTLVDLASTILPRKLAVYFIILTEYKRNNLKKSNLELVAINKFNPLTRFD